jgi:hypothetical protein
MDAAGVARCRRLSLASRIAASWCVQGRVGGCNVAVCFPFKFRYAQRKTERERESERCLAGLSVGVSGACACVSLDFFLKNVF